MILVVWKYIVHVVAGNSDVSSSFAVKLHVLAAYFYISSSLYNLFNVEIKDKLF